MTNVNFQQNPNNKTYSPSPSFRSQGYLTNLHYNISHKDSYDRYERKKRQKKLGLVAIISSSAVIAGAVFVGLATGKSQVVSKKIQNFTAQTLAKVDSRKNKHLHKFLTKMANGFERVSKVMTNSTPIKDYSLYKLMDQTAPTRKLRDKVSKVFTKENLASVRKSKKKTVDSYFNLVSTVDDAIKKSEANPSLVKNKEKFEDLKKLMGDARKTPEFLSENYFRESYATMEKDMNYLSQEMSLKRLLSKESLDGFLPEMILVDRRSDYAKKLFKTKNEISCSFFDLSRYARDCLNTDNVLIYSVKDPKAQRSLRNCSIELDKNLKNFVKNSPVKDKRKQNLLEVKKSIQNFRQHAENLPAGDVKQKLLLHLDEYENLFSENKYGSVQKMRILAGDVWGSKSPMDLEIKKAATEHTKDVNTMLKRMVNMFDKQRDITLGSGPTDVLGLLAPIAVFGVALKKDENKDQRVGTSLKLGIPILGSTLVYLKTLALQFNGFKAFATSLGAGIILNTIGGEVFKQYQHHQEKKHPGTQNFNTEHKRNSYQV